MPSKVSGCTTVHSVSGAQRAGVQAPAGVGETLAVPLELLDVGQQVGGQADRLGPLHVGVRRHHGVCVPGRQLNEDPLYLP
jgi:hypothetical protein